MSPLTQSSVRSGIGEPDDTHRIPVGDGAALSTDIYLPLSRSARTSFPTLVVRTPYGKRGSTDRVSGLAAYFRDLGIAVVVQDIRGKFDSSGERVPFRHELSDGYQTVDWIAQQRWSDGSVIPYGDSYAGFTAWAAAASGHRSIRGAVVRVTTPDIGSHWMYRSDQAAHLVDVVESAEERSDSDSAVLTLQPWSRRVDAEGAMGAIVVVGGRIHSKSRGGATSCQVVYRTTTAHPQHYGSKIR